MWTQSQRSTAIGTDSPGMCRDKFGNRFKHPDVRVVASRIFDATINQIKYLNLRLRRGILRRIALVFVVATLTACGFTPAYGPNGVSESLRGSIIVDEPEDRTEFVLVAHLEERLGQPQAAPYALTYLITTSSQGLGVTPEQSTTRYNVTGRIDYIVKDIALDEVAHRGSVETFTGYSATGSIIGAPSAEVDARERLMVALADQIVTELIASAPDWKR